MLNGLAWKELTRGWQRQWRDRQVELTVSAENGAARDHEVELLTGRQQLGQWLDSLRHLLEVVEQQQDSPGSQGVLQDVQRGAPGYLLQVERVDDGRQDQGRITNRPEGNEEHAVLVPIDQVGRQLQRKSRLPNPTRPGQDQ